MAQSFVQTSTEGMQRAGQVFADTANDFTARLHSINAEMSTLQTTWTGSASAGFGQAMQAWETSFQKVINELVGMLEAMGVNTNQYVTAEDTAAGTAASFANTLPGF